MVENGSVDGRLEFVVRETHLHLASHPLLLQSLFNCFEVLGLADYHRHVWKLVFEGNTRLSLEFTSFPRAL